MNTQKQFESKSSLWLVCLVILLISAKCTFPLFSPPPATATALSPTETVTATASKEIMGPVTGAPMQWMDGSYFVYVPEGEFLMGANLPEGADHSPAHTVNLAGFWIQQTEVTNKMFAQCVELGICATPNKIFGTPYWYADSNHSDFPVAGVDWANAQSYCNWIQGNLPTEAQWEKAARGTEAFLYPWGNTDPTCDLLNFKSCHNPPRSNRVLSYLQGESPYKAADLAGNISEWISDWFAADYYAVSPTNDPAGPETGTLRVIRGSNFISLVDALNITLRSSLNPTLTQPDLGFRCVLAGDITSPPPACTVTAYTPIPTSPTPPDTFEDNINLVSAYCEEPDSLGTAIFTFPDFPDGISIVYNYHITSDAVLYCFDMPDGKSIQCYGTPLQPGEYATVSFCPRDVMLSPEDPACPVGYTLDAADGLCHFDAATAGSGPDSCGPDETWEDDFGCVPLASPGPTPCPPGFFEVFFSDWSIPHECWPLGGADGDANMPCLVGTYVPESDCCQIPETFTPICSIGYSYDPTGLICVPDTPPDLCTSFTFFVAACPTLPPPELCHPSTCSDPKQAWCPSTCGCEWSGSCPP